MDCGSTQTFTCNAPGEPIKWTTSGLSGIDRGPFLARIEAIYHPRITSHDSGEIQTSLSGITISGFNKSDNGGIIQCVNAENNNVRGMASISVGEWLCEFCTSLKGSGQRRLDTRHSKSRDTYLLHRKLGP